MRQDVAQEVKEAKTFTPGKPVGEEQKLTDEHRAIYAERIARATTVDEVSHLSRYEIALFPLCKQRLAGVYGVVMVVLRVLHNFLSAFRSRGHDGPFPSPYLQVCLILSELDLFFTF